MQKSESIALLSKSLVKAQSKLKPLLKDSVNPHFRNGYASLVAVSDAAKEALNAQGIALVQLSEPSAPGTLRLETILLHESGEWLSGVLEMPLPKADPQGWGSAQTYARRYSILAVIGLAAEDGDDDAAAAMPSPAPQKAPPAPVRAPQSPVKPPAPVDPPVDWEKWQRAFSALLAGMGANAQAAIEGAGVPFDPSLALYRLMEDSEKRRIYAVVKGLK